MIAVAAVTGLVVEVASQLFVLHWAGSRFHSFSPYTWSPYGLVRNNPDLTSPAFHISANGFRSEDVYTRRKPPHTLRILLLGGSVLYSGLGRAVIPGVERVDSGSTIAQYLEKKLRADGDLASVNIEVLNAAVNFNRIPEVATAYIVEYAFWEPDAVVVLGSANNFGIALTARMIEERQGPLQLPHPWRYDFERTVNERTFYAMTERILWVMSENLATCALAKKAMVKGVDGLFGEVRTLRVAMGLEKGEFAELDEPLADWTEYDRYVDEYLGYAGAMAAVAHRHDQRIAFFWEYFIAHLGDIKPFSDAEKHLYEANRLMVRPRDAEFDFHARDRVAAFCGEVGVTFIDPIEELRRDDKTVFIDYLHYTREGNALMARVIHQGMKPTLSALAAEIRADRR